MTSRLNPGDPAPAFSLLDAGGEKASLSDFAGQRVIVYFYPAAMTPGCTTQAVDFAASLDELSHAGLQVVGISPDEPAKLAQFRDAEAITFPLLSDPDRTTLADYAAFGKKKLYGKLVEGVIRSTFVVDVDNSGAGTISVAQYGVKATGHVAKLRHDLGV